ncbi:helix-turn-helix domain-containing protein [Kushneria aurantia]|uniref:Helix-turn-helix domain-containing protein n=1 Tax=Kushneria aurantia TaxID=504092 RepID=A0ABV6G2S6_9GAMM|nr:helix-turn-helix transcriptional regulator [Kushneria aurantia]
MSSTIASRLREIREAETNGRHEFSQVTGISKKTIEGIEQTGRIPRGDVIEAVCRIWPRYALWLTTGMVDTEGGQISPEVERARKELKTQRTVAKSQGK